MMSKTMSKNLILLAIAEIGGFILFYYLIVWYIHPDMLLSNPYYLVILVLLFLTLLYYILYVSPRLFSQSTGLNIFRCQKKFLKKSECLSYGFFIIIAIIFIYIIIYLKYDTLFPHVNMYSLLLKFFFYLISAVVQDLFFFAFLFMRIKYLFNIMLPNIKEEEQMMFNVLVFVLLFTLFHLPNYPLMALSFLFALGAGILYYYFPNLCLIIGMHAFLGTLLHRVYQMHMKIGCYYLTEEGKGFFRKLIPFIDTIISQNW